MKRAVSIAILLLPAPVLGGSVVSTVPHQFVGDWASSPDKCGSDADDMAIHIDSRRISYWESHGPLKAIVVRGRLEVALIAELSDEGETWLAAEKFRLSPDGDRLIDDTAGQEVVRHRCPAPKATRPNNSFKPKPLRGSAQFRR